MTRPDSLKTITIHEFNARPGCQKVIVHEHPRCFAEAVLPNGETVVMCWASDTIQPELRVDPHGGTWITVDQRITCIGADGRVVVSLGTGSSVLGAHCCRNATVILCETEAIAFNSDYTLRALRSLPSLPIDVEETGTSLRITLDSGLSETIN